jgi:hypothetical protein
MNASSARYTATTQSTRSARRRPVPNGAHNTATSSHTGMVTSSPTQSAPAAGASSSLRIQIGGIYSASRKAPAAR